MSDMWKGFNFEEKDLDSSYYDLQELSLEWKYANKNEIIKEFIQVAKTLGSEEQLEAWLNDVYDACYEIGYQEAIIHDIEAKAAILTIIQDEFEEEE